MMQQEYFKNKMDRQNPKRKIATKFGKGKGNNRNVLSLEDRLIRHNLCYPGLLNTRW